MVECAFHFYTLHKSYLRKTKWLSFNSSFHDVETIEEKKRAAINTVQFFIIIFLTDIIAPTWTGKMWYVFFRGEARVFVVFSNWKACICKIKLHVNFYFHWLWIILLFISLCRHTQIKSVLIWLEEYLIFFP